jgi:tellurite methyltransferase
MNNLFAENIIKFRKIKKYTQEDLAQKLSISSQAISKWETGQSYPDLSLLSDIAFVLDTDINSLMGYIYNKKKVTIYEDEYKNEKYYWGLRPSYLCYKILQMIPPIKPLKLLDVGCGEGKDAVFFAKNGYDVTAFDIADAGIDKAKRLADMNNVNVCIIKANILDFRLDTEFDVIFSSGVFNYIASEFRDEILGNYQEHTSNNGFNAFNVFIRKPFISPAPEKETTSFRWNSGELFKHYSDWLIHSCDEMVFDCNSSGIPHKHCMDTIIAEKIMQL